MNDNSMARALRYGVVKGEHLAGNLTDAEAKVILAGPLTPGDPSTIVDDSDFLGKTQEQVNFILDDTDPSDVVGYVLEWFQRHSPTVRGDDFRKFAIVITELEKVYAYAKVNLK